MRAPCPHSERPHPLACEVRVLIHPHSPTARLQPRPPRGAATLPASEQSREIAFSKSRPTKASPALLHKGKASSPTPPTPIQSPRRRAHVENNDRAHLLCLELSSPNRITHFQFRLDWNTPASVIMISIGRRDKQRHARTINPKYLIHTR